MRFSLRQIEVFLSTAKLETLSEAALHLNMSQSAASESLKNLEESYGTKLFDRVGRRLQLNDFGRVIKKHAEILIDQAKSLDHSLSQSMAGDLNIGATLSIGNYLAIHILSEFKTNYPETHTTLEVANTTHITEKVANFELDIGLIEGEVTHPDLEIIPWRHDELVVFCPPNHPLETQTSVSDEELAKYPWILREKGSGTRQAFEHAMQGLMPHLNITLELQHTEAIKRAVEADMGLGCLSRITLSDAFKRGSLKELTVTHRNFKRRFYLVLHKNKFRSKSMLNWLKLCESFCN